MIKKRFLVALALVGSVSLANAQETFHQESTVLNVGVGLGGFYPNTTIPPLSASLDYGVVDNLINDNNGSISIGGYVGYVTAHTILGARSAFHYQFAPKLDTYAGLMLGWNIFAGTGTASGGFTYSTYIGARYFITENIGAFAEAGYGVSYLNLGVTIKL